MLACFGARAEAIIGGPASLERLSAFASVRDDSPRSAETAEKMRRLNAELAKHAEKIVGISSLAGSALNVICSHKLQRYLSDPRVRPRISPTGTI